MHTVGRNLIEGALLVVAVLFLLLGDLRAGLVVAVTIPLSLLFAVTVMKMTGASGNLMSLGAIDFGLLVDGAVIIVENSVRRLSERRAEIGRDLSPDERTALVAKATLEVRSAIVFGEAIIAIVYLPILALTVALMSPPMTTVASGRLLTLFVLPVVYAAFGAERRGSANVPDPTASK